MSQNIQDGGTKPNYPNMPPYPPPYQRKRGTGWVIPLVIIGAIVVVIFIFFAIMFASFSSMFESKEITVKDNSVLYLTLNEGLEEYTKQNPFSIFTGSRGSASFLQTLRAIEHAKTDDKIKGIYIKPGFAQIGWAKGMELQNALEDFKTSGKFIYAFIEIGAEGQYFHSLPADTIFMPNEGMLEMNGFAVTSMFFTGLFEKLGIKYHVEHFEDFKSAGDMFSKKKFTDSARHQLQVIVNQRFDNFVKAIAKNRNLEENYIRDVINRGYYTADSLHKAGFVDVLAQETTVLEFMKYRANGDEFTFPLSVSEESDLYTDPEYEGKLRLISPSAYASTIRPSKSEIYDENIKIAVINGVGGINSGREESPFGDDYAIRSGDFVRHIRSAREDEKVKAIIIRIDSPGGSVIGSDEIWEEIQKTRKIKPVYASMSDVAASGGYYMAMACDTIIAHPATITGSIGVVFALPNLAGTIEKIGITVDTLSSNEAAQFLNTFYPYDETSKKKLYDMAKSIYDRFLNKVGQSRNMTYDEVRAIARGRVWTGEDALRHNLIDTLGGIQDALNIVKNRLGIPLDKRVIVRTFPEPEDEMKMLLRLFGLSDEQEELRTKTNFFSALGFNKNQYDAFYQVMPDALKPHIKHAYNLYKMSEKENILVTMPYLLDIK